MVNTTNTSEALILHESAVEYDLANAIALYQAGKQHFAVGATDRAEACYRAAVSADPTYKTAIQALADLLWDKGEIDEACACFHHYIEKLARDFYAHAPTSWSVTQDAVDALLYRWPDGAQPIEMVQSWLRQHPNSLNLHGALILVLRNTVTGRDRIAKAYEDAKPLLNNVTADVLESAISIGLCLSAASMNQQAESLLLSLLDISSDSIELNRSLLHFYSIKGQKNKGMRFAYHYAELLTDKISKSSRIGRGDIHEIVDAWLQADKPNMAVEAVRSIMERFPDFPAINAPLALALARSEDKEGLQALATSLIEMVSPNSSETHITDYRETANTLSANGLRSEAVALMERIVDLHPHRAEILGQLAHLYGNDDLAQKTHRRAAHIFAENATNFSAAKSAVLSWGYAGDWDQALAFSVALVAAHPQNPRMHSLFLNCLSSSPGDAALQKAWPQYRPYLAALEVPFENDVTNIYQKFRSFNCREYGLDYLTLIEPLITPTAQFFVDRARVYQQLGDKTGMAKDLEQAIQRLKEAGENKDYTIDSCRDSLISLLLDLGREEEAVEVAMKFQEKVSGTFKELVPLFKLLQDSTNKNLFQQAWTHLNSLLPKMSAEDFDAGSKIAETLAFSSNFRHGELKILVNRLSAIDPENIRLMGLLRASSEKCGDIQGEIACARKEAYALIADWDAQHRNKIWILLNALVTANDRPAANRFLVDLLNHYPMDAATYSQVFSYLKDNWDKELVNTAWQRFSFFLDKDAKINPDILITIASSLITSHEFDRALLVLQKQDKCSDAHNRPLYAIGDCLKKLGRHEEAKIYFRKHAETVTQRILDRSTFDYWKSSTMVFSWVNIGEHERALKEACRIRDLFSDLLLAHYIPLRLALDGKVNCDIGNLLDKLIHDVDWISIKSFNPTRMISFGILKELTSNFTYLQQINVILKNIISLFPDDPSFLQMQADLERRHGEDAMALNSYRRNAELIGKRAESSILQKVDLSSIINAWIYANDIGSAIKEAKKYVNMNPDNIKYTLLLLRLLYESGNIDDFTKTIHDSWGKWPGQRDIGELLIRHYRDQGNIIAVAECQKALMHHTPISPASKIMDAVNLPLDEARNRLQTYFYEFHNDELLLKSVCQAQASINDSSAQNKTALRLIDLCKEKLSGNEEDEDAWCTLAEYQREAGRQDDAIESLTHAVNLNPGNIRALQRLCALLAKDKANDKAAMRVMDEAAGKRPNIRTSELLCLRYANSLIRMDEESNQTSLLVAAWMLLIRHINNGEHADRYKIAKVAIDLFERLSTTASRKSLEKEIASPTFLHHMTMLEPEKVRLQVLEWLDAYESGNSPALHLLIAVDYLKRALGLCGEESIYHQKYTSELVRVLFRMVQIDPAPDRIAEVITLCRAIVDNGKEGYLITAMEDASATIRSLFEQNRWADVVTLSGIVTDIGDRLRNLLPSWGQKETWLATTQENCTHASYALYRLGYPEEAVATYERGLATLMRDELALRDLELDHVRSVIADRRQDIDGQQLEDALATFEASRTSWASCWEDRLNNPVNDGKANKESLCAMRTTRDRLLQSIEQLRQCPELREFLTPPRYIDIAAMAIETPLVYITYSSKGGVVFIVGRTLRTINLPGLTTEAVTKHIGTYLFHYHRYRAALAMTETDSAPSAKHEAWRTMIRWLQEMDKALAWLWATVVGRVIRLLKDKNIKNATLVGGGKLRTLPLAAAYTSSWWARCLFFMRHGQYPPPLASPRRSYAIDFVCFNTVPSAFALEAARRARAATERPAKQLVSFQWRDTGYLGFEREIKAAHQCYPPPHHNVVSPDSLNRANKENLLSLLSAETTSVLQFSGHGKSNFNDPLNQAGLLVGKNEWLMIKDILLRSITLRACVLSACESGLEPKKEIPNEAIGLPAALLHSGVAAVIAPLWTVSNLATAEIVSRFHQTWPSVDGPAQALHEAQLWLRKASWRDSQDLDGPNFVSRTTPVITSQAEEVSSKTTTEPGASRSNTGCFDDIPSEHPFFWAAFICTGL